MSFPNRPLTPRNIPPQFLSEYHKCYNTFNKSKNLSFRDKIQQSFAHPKYVNFNNNRPHSYRTFLKSAAPFNYYNDRRDNLFVCYNGGPKKEFYPVSRSNIVKNRTSTSLKFRRPCGCYSNYNVSKYSQVFDPYYSYNNFYQGQELPAIDNNTNARYSDENYMSRFDKPKIRNKGGKISYKLKENVEDFQREEKEEERMYTEQSNKENIESKNRVVDEKINTGKSMNDDFRKKNYLNLKPRRRFHKTQIFNNYKPFLVDDFKDYGEYV